MVMAPERTGRSERPGLQRRWLVAGGVIVIAVATAIVWALNRSDDAGSVTDTTGTVVATTTTTPPDEAVMGSGTIASEERPASGFSSVEISGEGRIELIQGADTSVVLETDANLLPLVTTEVRDGTLYLGTAAGVADVDPTQGIVLTVTLPTIEGIAISGAGTIVTDGLAAETLTVELSGAGSIDLQGIDVTTLVLDAAGSGHIVIAGEATEQRAVLTGTAGYDGADLLSAVAEVESNSVSAVVVWVTDRLDVIVRGTGAVEYYGTPLVESELTGAGALRPLGEREGR